LSVAENQITQEAPDGRRKPKVMVLSDEAIPQPSIRGRVNDLKDKIDRHGGEILGWRWINRCHHP